METQTLADFVGSVSGQRHLRVEHDYGYGYVKLQTSEAERRQAAQDIRNVEGIVLELLRNARDAHARHVFVSSWRDGGKRKLVVVDDGEGIPASMHEEVFEPRVTSKLDTNHMDAWGMHGRGMALFSIRVNAESARVIDSSVGLGCAMGVSVDLARLPERNDQSTFPSFEMTENGVVNVRGPRNVLRTACEFAIEARDACSVYVGPPTEIAATMYGLGIESLSAVDRAFCKDPDELPIVKRLATCGDPKSFSAMATKLGLGMSERSARRILDGAITGLDSMIDCVTISQAPKQRASKQRKAGAVSARSGALKLDKSDVDALGEAMSCAYSQIAGKYYLDGGVKPSVRVSHGRLMVSIPIVEEE